MIDWWDLVIPPWLCEISERVEPWLPVWLTWLLAVPFCALLCLTATVEWLVRVIFTPAKFVKRS